MPCGLTDPVACVGQVVGGAAKAVADSAFSAIAADFGQAADTVVNWLWRQIAAATAVSLGGAGFRSEMAITAAIAVTVGLGLFVIQVIASVLRHQPGGLARAGRGLLVAFVAGGLAISVLDVLLAAVDSLSAGVVQVATGGSITQMGAKLLAPTALSAVSNGAVVVLMALVMVAASAVVWAALMVRKLLIIVAAVFAPIAFTGSLAEVTGVWVRRWIETTIALVFSKLVLVIIFAIGLGVLTGGVGQTAARGSGAGAGQSLTQTVTGALILVMAGLSPWMAIKLVHFAGDSFHTVHAQAASSAAGVQMVAAAPRKMSALRSSVPPSRAGGHGQPGATAGPAPGRAGFSPAGRAGPSSGVGAGSAAGRGAAAAGGAGTAGVGAAAGGAAVATGGASVVAGAAVGAGKAAASKAQSAAGGTAEATSVQAASPGSTPAKAPGPGKRKA
jgi:hypothetical protein